MSDSLQRRKAAWRNAMLHALQHEVDAKAHGLSPERVTHLTTTARMIREYAEGTYMPGSDVQEVTRDLIGDMTRVVDGRVQALVALVETGDTEEFKAKRRLVLAEEAEAARLAALNGAIEAVHAAVELAHKTRYNAPREAERERSEDLADAEIMSRMRRGPEELEAEARGYLAAGNPRGAMVRLDALALMGANSPALRDLRKAVDAGLDRVIPHRKQALEIEEAAAAATREFAIAEATTRARLESALGNGERAAVASIAAKMAAAPDAFGPGIAGVAPDLGGPKRPSSSGPVRPRTGR